METKICSKCGRELSLDNFGTRNKAKGTLRAECKECHSKYMKSKYQERKEIIQELKAQKTCAKCGDNRGYVLDFHHINPEDKVETVARLTSQTHDLSLVYNEVEKCIVLCANCHREFHYMQNKDKDLTLIDYLKK